MLQDLDEHNTRKLTGALVEVLLTRPLLRIGKRDVLRPHLEQLWKLYDMYNKCMGCRYLLVKTTLHEGDALSNNAAMQQFLDYYQGSQTAIANVPICREV